MERFPQQRLARHPRFYAYTAIMALWFATFSLAAHLALGRLTGDEKSVTLVEAVFGESRALLGNRFYKQADVYFHRGLDDEKPVGGLAGGLFGKLREQVSPSVHMHAESVTEIREIMPWLELSMRVNPKHQESVLVMAYWLGNRMQRQDLAEAVLLRAQQNLPFTYAVQLEKARLYLHLGRYEPALKALNAALAFWTVTANPESQDDLIDKADALYLRALLLEQENRIEEAIVDYRELLTIAPLRYGRGQRLKALTQGTLPQPPAAILLERMKNYVEQSADPAHKANRTGDNPNVQ